MSIVLYFEIRRKRKIMLRHVIFPAVFSLALFLVCMVVDALFPDFNQTYMKWPDLLKDFLCLKPWSARLWMNVWQFFALGYPFYLICVMTTEIAAALSEEERLETLVYLHNAGVSRKMVFVSKWLVWAGETLACCGSLLLLQAALAAVLRQQQAVKNVLGYYAILFFVCLLYLSIGLFAAASRAEKGVAADTVMVIVGVPLLVSRIPALLRFLSALLVSAGREGAVIGQLKEIGEKTEVLTILSPLTWSWPALSVQRSYVVCGVILCIVLWGTAFSLYSYKKPA